MAHGFSSAEMVIAMGKAGMMGMLGAGGLSLRDVENKIEIIQKACDPSRLPYGVNLLHSPQMPQLEEGLVDILLAKEVRCVSASAFMKMESSIVRYACHGLQIDRSTGLPIRKNRLLAKVSRPEVAACFMKPPPREMLDALVRKKALTRQEADLALGLPLAEDITAEADSGGHTDNRPLTVILSAIMRLRDEIQKTFAYPCAIRVGAAGGLGTPTAVAGAFALGAAYVVTGSINQATHESSQSTEVKHTLTQIGLADVTMAPAADMFEMGAQVQVAKRGSLYAQRAGLLYRLYREYAGIDAIPSADRQKIERDLFRAPLDEIWEQTKTFWMERHPAEVEKAHRDPKHEMALVFRWYLGQTAHWARAGVPERRTDFQIWCGPAMGAFNDWAKDSFLEDLQYRSVVQIALNLLEGAAAITRAHQARCMGVPVPPEAFQFRPQFFKC